MSRGAWAAAVVLLVGLALAPSWPWRTNPYLRDDGVLAATNPAVRELQPVSRYLREPSTFSALPRFNRACYRPLSPLTLAWDAARSGAEPESFRVTNLLLHALSALLVLGFCRVALRELASGTPQPVRDRVALGVALLFAAHPFSAFSAQYISNRSLLLMTLGSFATLWSQVAGWSDPRPGWALLRTSLVYLVALLGKENAVTLPVAALLLVVLRGPTRRRLAAPALLAVMAAAFVGVRAGLGVGMSQAVGHPGGVGRLAYVLGQLRVQLTEYLPAHVWWPWIRWEAAGPPGTLADPLAWGAATVVVALGAWAIRRRRSDPVLALAILAYALPQLPTMLLPQPLPVLYYRPYAGSPFLYLGLLWLLRDRLESSKAGVAAALVLGLCVAASYRVGAHQRTPEAAWTQAVRHGAAPRAHLFLAMEIRDPESRLEAFARLIRRFPRMWRTYYVRGEERLLQGDARGATGDLAHVFAEGSETPWYYLLLSLAATRAGDGALAARAQEHLGGLPRVSWPEVRGFAEKAMRGGDPALAQEVLRHLPEDPAQPWKIGYLRALAAQLNGNLEEALRHYAALRPAGPDAFLAYRGHGGLLAEHGRCPEARPILEKARGLRPGDGATAAALQRCGGDP